MSADLFGRRDTRVVVPFASVGEIGGSIVIDLQDEDTTTGADDLVVAAVVTTKNNIPMKEIEGLTVVVQVKPENNHHAHSDRKISAADCKHSFALQQHELPLTLIRPQNDGSYSSSTESIKGRIRLRDPQIFKDWESDPMSVVEVTVREANDSCLRTSNSVSKSSSGLINTKIKNVGNNGSLSDLQLNNTADVGKRRSDRCDSSESSNSNGMDSAHFCIDPNETSEQFLEQGSNMCITNSLRCLWQDCTINLDATINVLEHIQTVHVAPQIPVMDGYICLWEGCKVYNKKSCSLSWLERHVLSHGGSKPFKCIIPGCGLSFGSQGALQRHVNSHITNSGVINGASGPNVAMTNRRLDSSLSKSARRKKMRQRKQRHIIGQHVDFFDKHTMEVIKYTLATSREMVRGDQHGCFFRSEILHWRFSVNEEEPHVLVRWHPFNVLPDEWVPQSKHVKSKLVPFRQLPPNKIKVLYPNLFPPERKEKAQRKWKPRSESLSLLTSSCLSSFSSSSSSSSTSSSFFSSASSPTCSVDSEGSGGSSINIKDEPVSPFSTSESSAMEDEDYESPVPDWVHYLAEVYVSS